MEGKLSHVGDPKDGYPVSDCRDALKRRVLEFIIPIIHLDKPTWVTITIGNTVFGALNRGRLIDWEVVFRDLAHRLVARVGKPKPTLISPFFFHLYEKQGILTKEEETDYKTAQELRRYWITPKPGSRPKSKDDRQGEEARDPETPTTSPLQEGSGRLLNRLKRIKTTY